MKFYEISLECSHFELVFFVPWQKKKTFSRISVKLESWAHKLNFFAMYVLFDSINILLLIILQPGAKQHRKIQLQLDVNKGLKIGPENILSYGSTSYEYLGNFTDKSVEIVYADVTAQRVKLHFA